MFQDDSILEITLTGPFYRINRERNKEKDYKDATLSYIDEGQNIVLDVEFEPRGNFRLRDDVCNYAQLWVEFDKDQLEGTLFANQDDLKLVVQCKATQRYERYLVKEHQTYAMFNLITDKSFNTRLLKITYQDTVRDRSWTHLGFFIENKDRLSDRIDMDTVDLNSISASELDQQQANLVTMFMFMIANTDYSIITAPEDECCHNAKLFQSADGRYFPVPYDFDSSGFVDTSYAEPNPKLRLRSNRQRLYRGFCFPENIMNDTFEHYRALEDEILAIAADTTYVNEKTAEDSVEYLQEFFDIINDPEKLQDKILDDCRSL